MPTHSYSEFQTDTEINLRTISSYLGFLLKHTSLRKRPLNGILDQKGKQESQTLRSRRMTEFKKNPS